MSIFIEMNNYHNYQCIFLDQEQYILSSLDSDKPITAAFVLLAMSFNLSIFG